MYEYKTIYGKKNKRPKKISGQLLGFITRQEGFKISHFPKIRIYEAGISYYGRTYEEGKKISWKDGFRAI